MRIAFRTGGFVGMLTVGLGLLGASIVLLVYNDDAPTVLEGFGFGAALLAMFMRVGGGIFTKAADVGADLVGKVEAGHPRGRPPQRGDDRRQRRRQRRRLRRHGRRPVRVLRGDPGRRAHPRQGRVRLRGPDLPAGHRRPSASSPRSSASSSPSRARQRPQRPADRSTAASSSRRSSPPCSWCIAAFIFLPEPFSELDGVSAGVLATAGDKDPRVIAFVAVLIGLVLAARDPAAHRLLHRDQPPAGAGHRPSPRSPVRRP